MEKNQVYAIVDIETTGGSPQQSRITEIAVYLSDGIQLLDRFETLVNPEQHIPTFITKLTGIDDEMVASAPRFQDISSQLAVFTKDSVFVAHNAPFDYGMIRSEYREMGMDFHRRVLCTVKSGRKLLPGHESYSLGNICKELGIEIENRHRASGDAFATMKLFELLYQTDQEELMAMIEDGFPRFTGDAKYDDLLRNIPESTGVYNLHDSNGDILFTGSGTNIRKNVLQHLIRYPSRKAFELRNSIADISFEVTGSELLSLLMEFAALKRLRPIYNRRPRPALPKKNILKTGLVYIVDKGPDRYTKSVIRLTDDQAGWGYFPATQTINETAEFDMFIKYAAMGADFRPLIDLYLQKGRVEKIISA